MGVTQTQAAVAEYPVVRIEVHRGWLALDLGELWAYRELLYFFVWRDIKVRYKQTAIGAPWAVLQPVMVMHAFSLFLRQVCEPTIDQINPRFDARDRGPNRQFQLRRS
jgi:lipopolysaccharide transport system permease protein